MLNNEMVTSLKWDARIISVLVIDHPFLRVYCGFATVSGARRSSSATECFVHLRSNFSMAFTVASAFLLDAGYLGEEVTCFSPQSLRKVASC